MHQQIIQKFSLLKKALFLSTFLVISCVAAVSAQTIISVPFSNGFVGNNTANNKATSSYYTSALGWSKLEFAQNSTANVFVAQGNDIIGMVRITDANGVEHSINGFIKWRAPSGSVTTMVFSPSQTATLATNGSNGSATYTISSTKYIGLTFNGNTLTITGGEVTGNAATNGLLDALNSYLNIQPKISISNNNASVNEPAGSVTINVVLNASSTATISANYTTADSTALAGADYTAVSGTLTFAPGELSKTIVIPILDDANAESTETIKLILDHPINAAIIGGLSLIYILDDESGDAVPPVITGPDGNTNTTTGATSSKSIPENSTNVFTFTANEPVTWSITGGADQAKLSIDPNTGVVSFITPPDYELPTDSDGNNTYVIVITATDLFGNTTTQTLTITVTNVIEACNPIRITGLDIFNYGDGRLAILMMNNQSIGTQESLLGKYITVNGSEAILSSNWTNFDGTWYYFRTTPTMSFGTGTYSIVYKCESNPVIIGPNDNLSDSTAISVPENTTAVYTFTADESVTWSITGGADQAKLSIDPNTGVVSFISAPDYENPTDADANNTYIVNITATDAAGNVTIQTLTITVTNVDEIPPVISGPPAGGVPATGATSAKSIPENTTAVFTFTASEPVTWSITGGADQSELSINPGTGAVSFNTAPNFEVPTDADLNNTYIVIITATDVAGNVTSQTVTVTVTDVDETAPIITGPTTVGGTTTGANSAITVTENTVPVYTFTANESVTWSLGGGADQARFTINPSTGLVNFSPAPDFENPTDADANNIYVVIIKATDTAGNITTQTLTVTVTDVVENLAPTNITLSKMNLFEANAIGALIGNLTTTDPDVGDTHTYTLVSGAGSTSNAYFTISGNQLKAGVIFSYITQSTYSIRVRTTDAGGLVYEKVFSITISESPTVKGTGYNLSTGITPATSNPVISKGYFSNLTVSGTNLVGYSWTPVLNLSNTNTANPTATPSQTTTYAVTVTNNFGSTTVLYITVTVVEDYNITPRNAITPNGDGKNDTWVVANITSYPNNQVRIFDRAGRLLFVESNYQNGWDGTVNGVPLKEDTYYFVITFGPGVNPKKGFISIIR